jgi:hypothetical protein
MGVVEQWTSIEQGLDPKWHDARLDLTVADAEQLRRAAALLAPAQPGRMGSAIRFTASRSGAFVGPEAVRRMLKRVDEERIDATVGKLLLGPLVLLGIVSLLWWMRTDDLRLYGWVQFFPCLVLPLIFWLFAPKYSGTWYWFAAAGWYLLAKVLEYADAAIYSAGHNVMAGHALKHLAAAGACYAILRAFQTRQPVVS